MKTAVVVNAGLGALTLGIEQAGYKIIAAYEMNEKAADIHKRNLEVPVYSHFPLGKEYKEWYDIDLLAIRIHTQTLSHAAGKSYHALHNYKNIFEMLYCCHPRRFLFILNPHGIKNQFSEILEGISDIGYHFEYMIIDAGETLGLPIKEQTLCVIGARNDITVTLSFPSFRKPNYMYWQKLFEIGNDVDSWYYKIPKNTIINDMENGQFFCYSNREYKPTDIIKWNYMYIPLVKDINGPRKITHREIANIKGLPMDYNLSEEKNKSQLYKELMYAENVFIVKQVAKQLKNERQINRGVLFENLFYEYLNCVSRKPGIDQFVIERNPRKNNIEFDFQCKIRNQLILFELKVYNGNTALSSKVYAACERISEFKEEGALVLVVANEISDSIKEQCFEKYNVIIWDVGNLLWLFRDYPELKSEFVAFLDYAIDSIEQKPPEYIIMIEEPSDYEGISESKKGIDWEKRLSDIEPGTESFRKYEDVCIEILKYVLGDYLTLWKIQEPSNDGLYRFDLCCKIKSGTNQEFFDTIKNYFNTKYIVFEFKNYKDAIGQKEIYTTEKYLYEKALRKVAIIISRKGADDQALKAVKGSLREAGKLILCLADQNLLDMVEIKKEGEQEPTDILVNMLDDLLVHLEK